MSVAKLTPKELELMTIVVTSGEVKVSDWTTIAQNANMKTPKYARDTWGGIKKKLAAFAADAEKPAAGDGAGDDHETQPSAKKAKKAATPRKRKKDDDDEDDFETTSKKTPKSSASATPRAPRTPRGKAAKSALKVEEDNDAKDGLENDNIIKPEPETSIFGGDAAADAVKGDDEAAKAVNDATEADGDDEGQDYA